MTSNDVKSAAWLQVIELLTKKTWGRGSVDLVVRTKMAEQSSDHDICYLEPICRPEQTFISETDR